MGLWFGLWLELGLELWLGITITTFERLKLGYIEFVMAGVC